MNFQQIDPVRRRPVPPSASGTSSNGDHINVDTEGALIVAVKDHCASCDDVVVNPPVGSRQIVFISAAALSQPAPRDILVSPEALASLGIASAPFYVLIQDGYVVAEGSVLSSTQVSREIAPFCT